MTGVGVGETAGVFVGVAVGVFVGVTGVFVGIGNGVLVGGSVTRGRGALRLATAEGGRGVKVGGTIFGKMPLCEWGKTAATASVGTCPSELA